MSFCRHPLLPHVVAGYHFNQQSAELFLKEGVSMRNFNHAHVLTLLGVCFDDESQPMVILPFMAKGDLRTYVKDKKKVSISVYLMIVVHVFVFPGYAISYG